MNNDNKSPFHKGEQTIQTRMGVREKMERFGRQVIRDFMPDQHREFFGQLPFVFVGHADQQGWPWASILFGRPGFISSSNNKQLQIHASTVIGDPLAESLAINTRLGLLGIELETRRRNRLSAHVTEISQETIQLDIDQAFGNCPQYIQTRKMESIDPTLLPTVTIEDLTQLDQQAQTLIQNSDTFFVSSYVTNVGDDASQGVDVSHRGGKPGFIRIDNEYTITIPDYLGNFHFNTLGNFLENPKAGLLFIDFEYGHLLTLTGTVEIFWDSPETEYFAGAERLWKFTIDHGRWIKNALPLRWKLDEFSPNTTLTGTWKEAEAVRKAEAVRNSWLPYRVMKIVDESSVIKSFYLQPQNGQRPTFLAGQFLTLKVKIEGNEMIRTYTVSSAPDDHNFRISVKWESSKDKNIPDGLFSTFLHQQLSVGDVIDAKAPTGAFSFDPAEKRPAVLISAGVGITPMIAMARQSLLEGVKTRTIRPLTLISAARSQAQRAFFNELNEVSNSSEGLIRCFWALSQVEESMKPGVDFHHHGRISRELLQAILPIDDYDIYLCGPNAFMQTMYSLLRELGICDARIFAEAFGPAALIRDEDTASISFKKMPAASEAIVTFTDSQVEQAWSQSDGTLLEFSEAHGLIPQYGCRSGQCGACKVKLLSGKIAYNQEYTAAVESDEVLLCCAVPAAVTGEDIAKVEIKI